MQEYSNPPQSLNFTTAVNFLRDERVTSTPLTKEMMEKALQQIRREQRTPYEPDASYDRRLYEMYQHRFFEKESFLSPEMHDRIGELCRRDPLFEATWRHFTARVRSGLDDHIVRGFVEAIGLLLKEMHKQRDALNDRNLENIRGLGSAAVQVIKAYEDAVARHDPEYMTEAIEELDSAVYDINQKGVLDA